MQRDWAGTDGYMFHMKYTRDLVTAFAEIDAAKTAMQAHFEAKRHFRRVEITDDKRG